MVNLGIQAIMVRVEVQLGTFFVIYYYNPYVESKSGCKRISQHFKVDPGDERGRLCLG